MTTASSIELNPYSPPGAGGPPPEVLPRDSWDALQLSVESVARTWATRTLYLAGSVGAVIRYDSTGAGECVYVNDILAAKTPFLTWDGRLLNAVSDRVDFTLPCGDYVVPAQIDVYVSAFQLFRITEFKLVVCERIIYDESNRDPSKQPAPRPR